VSQANVDLMRRWYARLNGLGRIEPDEVDPTKILPELWERIDPAAEFLDRAEVPDARVYRGPEEAKQFFRKTWEIFAEIRWEPLEFIDQKNAVVVVTRVIGVGRESEVPVEMDETDVIWFEGNTIVRVEGFPTREAGLEAAASSAAHRRDG
jgi:ketosteroid isomerase-like protein